VPAISYWSRLSGPERYQEKPPPSLQALPAKTAAMTAVMPYVLIPSARHGNFVYSGKPVAL
jgi:hypothetical protein